MKIVSFVVRQENIKLKIFCLIIGLIGYFSVVQEINAASLSLSVDPPITIIDSIPSTVTASPIIIQNKGDSQITLEIYLKSFKAKGEDGGLEYLKNASPILKNIRILDANLPIESITLGPKQQKNLTLKIDLPQDTNVSDYYFSVIFISMNKHLIESNSSTNQLGIATNVLLSVGPKEEPRANLEEFSSGSFFEKGPVPFTVRMKNNGNHLIKPTGKIVIKNLFGQNIQIINLLNVNILCDSIRTIPTTLRKNNFLLGPYTATLEISTSDNETIAKTIYFSVFPLRVFAVIAASGMIIVMTVKKLKKYTNTDRT